MHIEIKDASNQEILEVIAILHAYLLKEGDSITAHYPDGCVVGYQYEPIWKNPDPVCITMGQISKKGTP